MQRGNNKKNIMKAKTSNKGTPALPNSGAINTTQALTAIGSNEHWQIGVMGNIEPDILGALHIIKPGDILTRKGGKHKGETYTNTKLQFHVKTVSELVKGGMEQATAEALTLKADKTAKKLSMARLGEASADDSMRLRVHTENSGTGTLTLSLQYTTADRELASVASRNGMTLAALRAVLAEAKAREIASAGVTPVK